MNRKSFGKLFALARVLAAGPLFCSLAAEPCLAQTYPYWDGATPGEQPSCGVPYIAAAQAKEGAIFGLNYGDPNCAQVMRWSQCDGWQVIGTPAPPTHGPATLSATFLIGNDLYVAGQFTSITGVGGTITATDVAKYDIVHQTWSAVGDGTLTDVIQAIAVDSRGNVYVGTTGQGVLPPNVDSRLLMVWNGSAWATVGGGLLAPSNVRYPNGLTALAVDGTNLFVGGNFDGAFNGPVQVTSQTLIKWNGQQWSAMANPFGYYSTSPDPHAPYIRSMAISGGSVLVAGEFTGPYDVNNNPTGPMGIAIFSENGGYIPTDNLVMNNDPNHPPGTPGVGYALAVLNGQVYVGGEFDTVGVVTMNAIAQWNGSQWLPLSSGLTLDQSAPGVVDSLAAATNYIFVGGNFGYAGASQAVNGPDVRWVLNADPTNCPLIFDVNFGGSPGDKTGLGAVGIGVNDFWNELLQAGQQGAVTFPNLQWSDGSASAISVTVNNAPGVSGGNPVNDGMYRAYIYPQNGGNVTVTVTNFPAGTYDFYVYGHANSDAQNGVFNLVSGSLDLGTQATTRIGSASWTTINWTDGLQYVLFGGVPVNNNQPVVLNALRGGTLAFVNGMQIVPSAPPQPIQALLDLNFGGSPGDKTGLAAVGQSANDYWNELLQAGQQGAVSYPNLKWADGSSSSVGITVNNAPGVSGGNPVNDGMYRAYIYPWYGGNITATITNLPGGTYDFYVYGHANSDAQNGVFNLTSGSTDYGVKATTTVGSASWTTINWQEGLQYQVFRGVSVVAGQPVVLTVEPCSNGKAFLNGMQIIRE